MDAREAEGREKVSGESFKKLLFLFSWSLFAREREPSARYFLPCSLASCSVAVSRKNAFLLHSRPTSLSFVTQIRRRVSSVYFTLTHTVHNSIRIYTYTGATLQGKSWVYTPSSSPAALRQCMYISVYCYVLYELA